MGWQLWTAFGIFLGFCVRLNCWTLIVDFNKLCCTDRPTSSSPTRVPLRGASSSGAPSSPLSHWPLGSISAQRALGG